MATVEPLIVRLPVASIVIVVFDLISTSFASSEILPAGADTATSPEEQLISIFLPETSMTSLCPPPLPTISMRSAPLVSSNFMRWPERERKNRQLLSTFLPSSVGGGSTLLHTLPTT